jgi:hypothetical protein
MDGRDGRVRQSATMQSKLNPIPTRVSPTNIFAASRLLALRAADPIVEKSTFMTTPEKQ